jgi:predicted Zn-dependent protease
MVMRNSGLANARREAIGLFKEALKVNPEDVLCQHALGDCYVKTQAFAEGVKVLAPLARSDSQDTREKTYPLLAECYERLGEVVKLGKLRDTANRNVAAQSWLTQAVALRT